MKVRVSQLPLWLVTGTLVFPILTVIGVIVAAFCSSDVNPLFSLILPSIVFEELLEDSFAVISDSYVLNFLFAILFWFGIGCFVGFCVERIKSMFQK